MTHPRSRASRFGSSGSGKSRLGKSRLGKSGAVAFACIAWLALAPAVAQERKPIPGTSVSLAAPKGFEPATGFSGLVNKANQASVLIVELPPEAHAQLSTLFGNADVAKANFARQNITIKSVEQIAVGGDKVPLLTGSQIAPTGDTFDKWIVLLKGEKTVMLTVQAPQKAKLAPAQIKAMIASVSLGKEPSLDEKLAALPFAIKAAAPFRVIDSIGGSGLLMTVGDKNTDPSGTQPLLVVAYQPTGPVKPGQEDALSESLLKGTHNLENATVAERKRVPFAGQDGMLLTGSFKHPNGANKGFAQYLAIGPDSRFVRLIVMADESEMPQLQPAIDQTAASISFKDK
ncbi:hypothetical protein IED13_24695 [Bosea sp. SSUT16]|uniref:Uncharacterized protein n=1 Tax=Bosea spartocytisi TaxID=2773451 RepID=A0A927EDN3_9HYPH|nr:hypothetical protein [Bosea spartocytisi]MBD3848910.1 hypothetical protein [Bosea spartocytisi]MCT4474978.1 hypothetical protein [Bosea spartocytisi]